MQTKIYSEHGPTGSTLKIEIGAAHHLAFDRKAMAGIILALNTPHRVHMITTLDRRLFKIIFAASSLWLTVSGTGVLRVSDIDALQSECLLCLQAPVQVAS